jgi:hypothetical protein
MRLAVYKSSRGGVTCCPILEHFLFGVSSVCPSRWLARMVALIRVFVCRFTITVTRDEDAVPTPLYCKKIPWEKFLRPLPKGMVARSFSKVCKYIYVLSFVVRVVDDMLMCTSTGYD